MHRSSECVGNPTGIGYNGYIIQVQAGVREASDGMTGMEWMLVRLRAWVAAPSILALIVAVNIAAYFAGLLFWYGYVMADPATPWWAWLFIPDCPQFALLGAIGLLMVAARKYWSPDAQARGRRWFMVATALSGVAWGTTWLPGIGAGWAQQNAMLAVWTVSLLLGAIWFRRPPAWLLGVFAFGQIKYGIWTITAWLLYWRNTAEFFGAPHFSVDSVAMTVTHVGLALQGLVLLTYFRPTLGAVAASLLWFGMSDFVDYGLGFYPAIPEFFIPLAVMQWSTITVTVLLTLFYLWTATRAKPTPVEAKAVSQTI